MLIIDGDYPMAFGAVDLNRDLTLPVEEIRSATPGFVQNKECPDKDTMASLPELRRGRIAAALVKVATRIQRPGNVLWGYRTGEIAYSAAQAQLAYYRILEKRREIRILATREDFLEHIDVWLSATEYENLPVGVVLGLEGGDPILWPEQIHEWWNHGIRVVSLSHYGISTYCHGTGTGTSGGLFPPAKALLREMELLDMILDVTHASDASVEQALDIFSGSVLASHQNCRALVPGERQFPDEQLKKVIERDGVIGASMDTWMICKKGRLDWSYPFRSRREVFAREEVTLEDFADHIDHVCQLAGNALHAAIGGDTDGQGGRDAAPFEIDTVADYQKLVGVLERRGYSSEDTANIMYRNWQRLFQSRLPRKK